MTSSALIRQARFDAGLTQAELAARASTSQAAVARYESGAVSPSVATLERLIHAAGAELVLSVRQATPTNLSGKRAIKLRRHRREVIALARQAGAVNVRLFGSVARGDDNRTSDIDLLVDFDIGRGLVPLVELADSLEQLLDERVDIAPVALLKPAVAKRALSEAVPL
jgi:predicted nucleotidyltransferase/DNA-binding XRE family transcriptional regulator